MNQNSFYILYLFYIITIHYYSIYIILYYYFIYFMLLYFIHFICFGLSPDIMNTIFKLRQNNYNLRNFHAFESQNPRTKKFGLGSIAHRASQLWKNVPEEIRNSPSLLIFKESIKKVPLISCSCHCCKTYIHHVGYI